VLLVTIALAALSFVFLNESPVPALNIVCGVIFIICTILLLPGFTTLEPNKAIAMVFFGKYKGTFKETGFFWFNPFMSKKILSLRARNLDVDPIKVNDKIGNPVMIGLVLVWKVKDTYRAMFEIDSQTMAEIEVKDSNSKVVVDTGGGAVARRMKAFENFVMIQSDAALRQVAGQYAYDDDNSSDKLTLRSGGEEINEQLEQKLNERLSMAGIEVIEARLNYLAYAPEIAAVMLRRQQASAIIAAREKIVEGAVTMVKMALDKIKDDEIVELDEDKKSAMVSNLLVVLCADEAAQPVLNTGTLNH
jgi:regulator of protease activity HflC (stomatin/prohibitin superfamily)